MQRNRSRKSTRRRNLSAACVTVLSVGLLYSSFDPVPAGEDNISLDTTPLVPVFEDMAVPVPPDAGVTPDSDYENDPPAEGEEEAVAATSSTGGVLSNQEAVKFCHLLLKDGRRFIETHKDYTVTFHKKERIGGDLKVPQSINMKVQHGPHFAVYMKWLTGTKGQQVLYSDEYEDGCMVVKFGGFKRMLPALRVDPTSSVAMAETRYPVTEAGIAGMIRQIAKHREADLKRGHGVSCVRLKDQEFNKRPCYCFLFKYDSPSISETYRKSIFMIDAERHIPLVVRNFTWGTDTADLSEEELDAQTLIEDYSFTDLDISRKLVAKDFSRENPSYRM